MTDGDIHRYPLAWRVLHWLSATVILWAISSGFYILLVRPSQAVIHAIADFNVAITLLFVPIFIIRILVSYLLEKPATPQLRQRQQKIANRAHALLYLMVVIVLVSGVLMMERDMSVFGWFEVKAILSKGSLTQGFFILHRIANTVLFMLLVAHILAVVYHQIKGIPLMKRMI